MSNRLIPLGSLHPLPFYILPKYKREDAPNIFTGEVVFIKSVQGPSELTLNDLISGKIHSHHHFCTLHEGFLEKVLSCSERSNLRIIETHFRKSRLLCLEDQIYRSSGDDTACFWS